MKDRLLQFLSKNQISATHLADEIGVQRSSVSHVLSGRNNPSYDFIHKILKRYDDLSADWLISGKGEMYQSPEPTGASQKAKASQPDLFSNINESPPAQEKIDQSENTKETEEQTSGEPPENMPDTQKNLSKVILFYDDGSFQEYKPS